MLGLCFGAWATAWLRSLPPYTGGNSQRDGGLRSLGTYGIYVRFATGVAYPNDWDSRRERVPNRPFPRGRGGKECAARNERSSDWPRGAEPPAPTETLDTHDSPAAPETVVGCS